MPSARSRSASRHAISAITRLKRGVPAQVSLAARNAAMAPSRSSAASRRAASPTRSTGGAAAVDAVFGRFMATGSGRLAERSGLVVGRRRGGLRPRGGARAGEQALADLDVDVDERIDQRGRRIAQQLERAAVDEVREADQVAADGRRYR